MNKNEISAFISDRIARCDERLGSRTGMLANLTSRIANASDNGLASAVFWYKWMTFGEAVQIRAELTAALAITTH